MAEKVEGARQGSWVVRILPCLVAVVASLVAAIVIYRLRPSDLTTPFVYSGDGLVNGALLHAIIERGTMWSNERLAAPFGQHYQDWPLTDLFPLYLGKVLSWLGFGWATSLNLVFLLTFPMIGASAWWVLRKIDVGPWTATVFAILYAVAPYHFGRGQGHLFLSGYYGVPLGIWLALSVLSGNSLFKNSNTRNWRAYFNWRGFRTVALCVLIGASSVYYAAFTVVLVSVAIAVVVLGGHWRRALPGATTIGLLLATILVCALPTLLYRAENGSNALAAQRTPADTEQYGLKMAQMLLPVDNHRISSFAELRDRYVDNFPLPGEAGSAALGLIGAAGFLCLVIIALLTLAGVKYRPWERLNHLSLLAIAAFLSGTVGGFSTLIALLLTPQIRAWNRISIVILFLAFAALALLIDRFLRNRPTAVRLSAAGVGALLVIGGAYDQSPTTSLMPLASNKVQYEEDAQFFGALETSMPEGSAIYQLPLLMFPEPLEELGSMGFYDHLRAYAHSSDLRWSYGGIEGRTESDWQKSLNTGDAAKFLPAIASAGFDGLYIDRAAYKDRAAAYESDVTRVTGVRPIESSQKRMSFFDIRAYAARLKAASPAEFEQRRREVLFPVVSQVSDRAYRLENDGRRTFYWAPRNVALPLVNGENEDIPTSVKFEVETASGNPAKFDIEWPDGERGSFVGGGTPTKVAHSFRTGPGRSFVKIITDSTPTPATSTDPRELSFRIVDLRVGPPAR